MTGDERSAPGEPRPRYQIDHTAGYFVGPRDAGNFEPLMRDHTLAALWLLVHCRVRHTARLARASHGDVWLERGQCVLGVNEVAERLGLSKSAAGRALLRMERLGLIVRDAGKRGSVITLPFYGMFGESGPAPWESPGKAVAQPWESRGTAADPNERENGRTGERETPHTPRAGEAGPGSTTRRPQVRELVEELFAYHLALCEQTPAGALKRPSPIATHHVIAETLHHPRIREASPEEIKRALDMLAVQARAKADAGEADPWWPLRTAWSPNVLADALSMPDETTARQRATKRSQGAQGGHNGKPRAGSLPALTAADYRAMADEEDEQP